jgi:hypothetical protein
MAADADRDLAEAIHYEITSPESVAYAIEVWRDSLLMKTWTADDRLKWVLSHVSRSAIDSVLARRQREAARTGPWEDTP